MTNTVMACLWRGTDLPSYSADVYDERYVVNLRRALNDQGVKLILMHDEFYADAAKQADVALPLIGFGVGGWSNILEIFAPNLFARGVKRLVAVGLDTIITGDISWLFEWDHAPVGLPLDPLVKGEVCDSVISWDYEGACIVWDEFMESRNDGMSRHHYAGRPSEMALLRDLRRMHGWATFDDTHPGKLLSYKVDVVKGKSEWVGASAVYFHGEPKPADLDESSGLYLRWNGD